MPTDRFAFLGDHLTADFNAQSYGGRLEGGYRFATPFVGIAPYAALQAQSFHTPSYSETGTLPTALPWPSARAMRPIPGPRWARFDRAFPVSADAVLALRGRVAWAHDRAATRQRPVLSDPAEVPENIG
jgi:outer membrane autotransporter protein